MVDAEEAASFEEGYINESDPSVLRFLIASRCVPHRRGAPRSAERYSHQLIGEQDLARARDRPRRRSWIYRPFALVGDEAGEVV